MANTTHAPALTDPLGVVVFDLDGTLTDTSEDLAFSVNHMRHTVGLGPLSVDEVLAQVGRGAPYLVGATLGLEPNDTDKLKEMLGVFETHYLAHQGERSHLYPGIHEALDALSSRYHLYVLSNKPHRATVAEVEKAGVLSFFQSVWGAGALEGLKPDPVGIKRALALSKMPAGRGVMVGDLHIDVHAGRNAGVKTCFVAWGFGNAPTSPSPDAIANMPRELPDVVDALFAR